MEFQNQKGAQDDRLTNEDCTTDSNDADVKIYIGKQELELVFDTIPEEICILDRKFRVVRANKSFADSVGLPIQDIIGKVCYRLPGKCGMCIKECPAKRTFNEKVAVLRKQFKLKRDNSVHNYEISTYPVETNTHEVYHVIEIRKDVTDEKQMLEYLVRSEKLASIGNMTAGIAHEMNNPLSGISGNAANLLNMPRKYGLNEKGINRITAILDLATRATAIMTDLLHLSRKPEHISVRTDINNLITETVNSLHVWGGKEIERIFKLDTTLPEILCDPSKIQQVLVHLITNAVQAIREHQKKQQEVSEKGRIVFQTRKDNGRMKIEVIDNGTGIPAEHTNKIFDPFFSTKPTGEGTGLGLSVSNKLIEEQGGKLFFESGNGFTMFTIEFLLQ